MQQNIELPPLKLTGMCRITKADGRVIEVPMYEIELSPEMEAQVRADLAAQAAQQQTQEG